MPISRHGHSSRRFQSWLTSSLSSINLPATTVFSPTPSKFALLPQRDTFIFIEFVANARFLPLRRLACSKSEGLISSLFEMPFMAVVR